MRSKRNSDCLRSPSRQIRNRHRSRRCCHGSSPSPSSWNRLIRRSLNTAVPTISEALGVTVLSMKSVLASYTLSLAVFNPDQRMDGRPVRHAPRLCFGDRDIHAWLVSVRADEQHPSAGRLPRVAGHWRGDDGARRPADFGAHVSEIRTRPRHELLWPYRPSSARCSARWPAG